MIVLGYTAQPSTRGDPVLDDLGRQICPSALFYPKHTGQYQGYSYIILLKYDHSNYPFSNTGIFSVVMVCQPLATGSFVQ